MTTTEYPATKEGYAALVQAEPGLSQKEYAARLGVAARTLRDPEWRAAAGVTARARRAATPAAISNVEAPARGADLAVYDPTGRSYVIPTTVAGLALTFTADQAGLDAEQMHILSPLGIEANWDPAQVRTFLLQCIQRGLDPWQKMAYLLKIDGKYVFHISIGGLLTKAEETGEYRGLVGPFWAGPDGVWREAWLDRATPPAAAKVGVLRAGFDAPVWGIATYEEFAVTKDEWVNDGDSGRGRKTGRRIPVANWRPASQGGKPSKMLEKCAKAAALRDAFPATFSGFYVAEETERMRHDAADRSGGDTPDVAERRRQAYQEAMDAARDAGPMPAFPGVDDDTARRLLLEELDEQARIFGRTRGEVTARWVASRGGVPVEQWPVGQLGNAVRELRRYVLEELRRQGRNDEADRYERAPDLATVEEMFGRSATVLDVAA